MSKSFVNYIKLNSKTKSQIAKSALGYECNPYTEIEKFILKANLLFYRLPENIQSALIDFQRFGNIDGGLLIKGLPEDPNLPFTPKKLVDKYKKKTFVSEFCCALFSTPLGEIFSYIQEKKGSLFQDLYPTEANKNKLSSESSEILLDFHTEVAFHPYLPDFLMLYCLRSDFRKEARTILASGKKIVQLLKPKDISLLKKPVFETGIDYSFGNLLSKTGGGRIVPILSGSEHDPFICFDPDLMKSRMNDDKIIHKVNSIAHQVSSFTILEPGDLLIIDNRRAIHGRTQFAARFDGYDRWLQRVLIRRELPKVGGDRKHNERIIRTKF